MKILLSNDDGFQAAGIVALYEALKTVAEVEVIAPEHNNSAKSNALTLFAPLYVQRAANGFRYVNGTPADCVHLALSGVLDYKPDLVISGINNGANMGDDTIYSGTVGAAMEGYLYGISAIAFSQTEKGWSHLQDAAQVARDLVLKFSQQRPDLPDAASSNGAWLLNINIPNVPLAQMKSPQLSRLGRRHAAEPVQKQVNPRGETMYWIGAAGAVADTGPGTDFEAAANGHVTITPLQVDLSDYARFDAWRARLA